MDDMAHYYERADVVTRYIHTQMRVDEQQSDAAGNLILAGRFFQNPARSYRTIRRVIEPFGFTPFFRYSADQKHEIVCIPHVQERTAPNYLLAGGLFLLTFLSVLLTGALNAEAAVLQHPAEIVRGLPFALSLMGILLAHEMGHYVVGRWRHAHMSLPYFLPMPWFLSFTGTLGAVIVQREPMEDRKTMLEVGIAGPLAGLAVAVPLLFYGLAHSTVAPVTPGGLQEGNSVLYFLAKWIIFGQQLPANGVDVHVNDVTFAAWIGLLITMINLMPVGQLDGGHVAYALFGERARYLGYATIALCFGMALSGAVTWAVWGVLAMLIGPRHPPPFNDIPRLSPGYTTLAIAGLALFIILFVPVPLR